MPIEPGRESKPGKKPELILSGSAQGTWPISVRESARFQTPELSPQRVGTGASVSPGVGVVGFGYLTALQGARLGKYRLVLCTAG